MPKDSVKTCPRCNKSDITSFSKCRFCSTTYNTRCEKNIDTGGDTNASKLCLGRIIGLVIVLSVLIYGVNFAYQSIYPALYQFYVHPTAAEQADMPSGLPALLMPPIQISLSSPQTFTLKGYTITKVASYVATARVIATSYNWWLDPLNEISRMDLALGWGCMADKRVLHQLSILHDRRHLGLSYLHDHVYNAENQVILSTEIMCSSANTHIIPANDNIEKIVESLHRNQIVTLTGSLVNLSKSGVFWNTSLAREDTGDGACEIMYVDSVKIH